VISVINIQKSKTSIKQTTNHNSSSFHLLIKKYPISFWIFFGLKQKIKKSVPCKKFVDFEIKLYWLITKRQVVTLFMKKSWIPKTAKCR
jgi:hypothetical protein